MIPSRGLRPASVAVTISRAHLRSSRLFSTNAPLRISSRSPARSPLSGIKSPWKSSGLRASPVIASLSASRFASTTSAQAQASAAEAAFSHTVPGAPGAFEPTSLNHVSEGFFPDLANMPEHIGYLKSIGLDYGWGPTSCIEFLMEHIHVYAGTPWWATIILTAAVARVCLVRLFIASSDVVAKQRALMPVTEPITKEMRERLAAGDNEGVQRAKQKLNKIHDAAGIRPMMAFVGPLFQGVWGFCSFRLMQGMAALPVPGLETGGLAWIQDLTVPDPYFILPLTTATMMAITARSGGETGGMKGLNPAQEKLIYYIIPLIALACTSYMPACLQLSFLASSSFMFGQGRLLRTPSIRERLGISPLYNPPPKAKTVDVNLIDRYQAPNRMSSAQPAPADQSSEKQGRLSRWIEKNQKELQTWIDNTLTQNGMPSGGRADKEKKERSKAALKMAEEYEKRRREEIRETKEWRDNQR